MRGTQWEAMLYGKPYQDAPDEGRAGVVTPDGQRMNRLCPFGPVELWKAPAARYVDSDAMRWVQRQYPHPPLVLWVGNNDAGDLRWHQVHQSKRYLDAYGEDRSDDFKRLVVGEGWKERYRTMFDAMRDAMDNDTWRKNLRFVGYGAFGPSHMGRWNGWKNYSLHTGEEMAWDWHAWDGASPSYYTHNWNSNRDHWVHSTQVQSMNWPFMLEQAWRANPDFWFEISTWDGNQVGSWMAALGAAEPEELVEKSTRPLDPEQRRQLDADALRRSKALQYTKDGQTYTPERALGWVQFGMWLLRPRVPRAHDAVATSEAVLVADGAGGEPGVGR